MISFLVGTIEEKNENLLVLDVNGVGYEMTISNNTLASLPMEGETVKVLTYLQVSENTGVCLYGFATAEEKAMFEKLITVSGIGPKSAIAVLSGVKLSELMTAIASGDTTALSKVKGLGKKSAERICLELKDKITAVSLGGFDDLPLMENINEGVLNDAVQTLINLGVNKNEAYRLARSKMTENATAEEIILKVLKEYGK